LLRLFIMYHVLKISPLRDPSASLPIVQRENPFRHLDRIQQYVWVLYCGDCRTV